METLSLYVKKTLLAIFKAAKLGCKAGYTNGYMKGREDCEKNLNEHAESGSGIFSLMPFGADFDGDTTIEEISKFLETIVGESYADIIASLCRLVD